MLIEKRKKEKPLLNLHLYGKKILMRLPGIEPGPIAWKATIL